MANKMKWFDWIAIGLLDIGAINWLTTAWGFNIVEFLLGTGIVAKVVYTVVGLAGLYGLYFLVRQIIKKV